MTSSEWPRSTRRAKQREQPLDVGEVEAGRRLVEDEERVRLAVAAEVRGELHALRLAAGERRERLAEAQVVEADVGQRLQAVARPRRRRRRPRRASATVRSSTSRIDAAPAADLEDLGLEARAVALGARHVDVGEELHLDLLEAVAGAGLAAAARRR